MNKRSEFWKKDSWILYQDDALAQNSQSGKLFFADKVIPVLTKTPYSPDLVLSSDFYSLSKVKISFKGKHFQSVEEIKTKPVELLKRLTTYEIQHCFEQWKTRMKRCLEKEGVYVEGDKS